MNHQKSHPTNPMAQRDPINAPLTPWDPVLLVNILSSFSQKFPRGHIMYWNCIWFSKPNSSKPWVSEWSISLEGGW